jgi:hypothetical protein
MALLKMVAVLEQKPLPELVPEIPSEAVARINLAFQLADDLFGIPQLLEYLASHHPSTPPFKLTLAQRAEFE